jgi:sulfatase maturation enzyme AslB (radical SAM superfamily)
MNNLLEIKELMLETLPDSMMNQVILKLNENKKRPLGKLNPWAWWIEIVRGCNLRCDFCPTRLFPKGYIEFMKKDVWIALLKTIQELTPHTRLELCNAGEPTLHPDFLEYLSIAREICPNLQILTYTNGTQITSGKLTYKQMFDAGLNMIFLDMYAPLKDHVKLAKESGYYWYHQDFKPSNAPNVFTYQNDPNIHIIMLANNPYNWSKRKLGRGYLQTFFNDLDWKAAKKFGMEPVVVGPNRRCDLPSKFVNINYDGTFIFCCFDYMRHTINEFGNIKNGTKDFFEFWLGEYMQDVRRKLYNKNRNAHEYCTKCSFTSIRCDIPYWKPEMLEYHWNGEKWKN